MRLARAGLVATSLLLASALGCGAPAWVRYEEELERTPAPAEHAVHSDRLASLMRGLDRLHGERLPQAMDVGIERERRAEAVRAAALGIARSAARIPDAAPASLDAAQRAEFEALARELEHRSLEVADAAPRVSSNELDARLRSLETTCRRCHARFRLPEASLPGAR
jgi:cytochrome c556